MRFLPYSTVKIDRRSAYVGWIIVITGLILTLISTVYVARKNSQEQQIKFEYEKEILLRRVETRMDRYAGALYQTRAFLINSPDSSQENLRNYIKDTEIFKHFPGLQGLGFSVMIKKENLKAHLQEMRKKYPGYKIWPDGVRETHSSIVVLEPDNERNRKALGFDMFNEPERRKAMERARDKNLPIMSGKVVLVQEDNNKKLPGFNLYLPVFGKNHELLGFVYTPFRAGELFRIITEETRTNLDVEVFSGDEISEKNLFYDSEPPLKLNNVSGIFTTDSLTLYGQKFTFAISQEKRIVARSFFTNIFVALGGLLITLFFFTIYVLTRKQMLVARMVAEEKHKLLEREKAHVEARDDFLSIASHELKTPLTSLKLQAQVMKRAIARNNADVFSPAKVTHLVNQIDLQTTRLTRLVDDMLDISRIRTGRLKMEKHDMEICEAIHDVVDRLRGQFEKNNLSVPEITCQENFVGHWDRFRIEQVMTNLLTNAIRYGNGKPVRIKIEKDDLRARISVIDQGIGIQKENLSRIFDQFERAGMSASEVSGLGLGLFITRQIVKAHNGDISVVSEPGKGSTFIVDLPLKEQENA